MITKKHRENKKKHQEATIPENAQSISEIEDQDVMEQQQHTSLTHKTNKFRRDLCEAFVSADIPLNKLSAVKLSHFLEGYTGYTVPNQSTLRKYYVPDIYQNTLASLQRKAAGKKLWVSLDETTDAEQRYVACFVFGILGVEDEQGKCYLGNVAELQSVNHSTVAAFFNDSIRIIWPEQTLYDNILVATTDAAPYMIKAMRTLKGLFPKMVHVTCLAHGLHRVAELVRATNPDVNRLISSAKSVFLKAPHRTQLFKQLCPNVPLPPSPVVTRWGTWLAAAQYYATNLEALVNVMMSLDSNEAQSIKECQDLVNKIEIKNSLTFIATNFTILQTTITKLETRGLRIESAVQMIADVEKRLQNLHDPTYHQKLTSVLNKNVGFQTIKEISQVLSGQLNKSQNEFIKGCSCSDLSAFAFAPVVSCDVERMFSVYNTILADNRRSFLFENLKQYLIIKCNE